MDKNRQLLTSRTSYAAMTTVSLLFLFITVYVFRLVYEVQPSPFLDEIFHIPQAQRYCKGLFKEWDPKITTLPGLYLLSVGALMPLSWITGSDLCGTSFLRMTNVFACLANFYIIYNIQKRLHKENEQDTKIHLQNLLSSLNLATFPVLYFFTFLYYTDATATGLILLTYLLELDGRTFLATLAASVAVLVRQTNIVWVALITFLSASHVLKLNVHHYYGKLSPHIRTSPKYLQVLLDTLLHIWHSGFMARIQLADDIFYSTGGFMVVGLCFVGFVIYNGGLVVGDHSAHQAVLHVPQLFYYSLFVVVFGFPYVVVHIRQFIIKVIRYRKLVLMMTIGCIIIIHFNTQAHPYLLADNRHYTFYIWKRLYERHFLIKYLLIPIYIFGGFSMLQLLKQTDFTFQMGYFTFSVICVIPQKLLEFRYFILPFLMLRLHFRPRTWWQLFIEFILFFCINLSTVYLFVTRTFYWSDSTEVQRFIW